MLYYFRGESGFLETQANRLAHPFESLLGLASLFQPFEIELALQLFDFFPVARLHIVHLGFMAALLPLDTIFQEDILVGKTMDHSFLLTHFPAQEKLLPVPLTLPGGEKDIVVYPVETLKREK
jgi:hypothetical protein